MRTAVLATVLLAGLPVPAARAALSANYCTCVITAAFGSAADGVTAAKPVTSVAGRSRTFTVDLRNGAVTGAAFDLSRSAEMRLWRSEDRRTWIATWVPRQRVAGDALILLRLEEQPAQGDGTPPVSLLAATPERVYSGSCMLSPPAGVEPD